VPPTSNMARTVRVSHPSLSAPRPSRPLTRGSGGGGGSSAAPDINLPVVGLAAAEPFEALEVPEIRTIKSNSPRGVARRDPLPLADEFP